MLLRRLGKTLIFLNLETVVYQVVQGAEGELLRSRAQEARTSRWSLFCFNAVEYPSIWGNASFEIRPDFRVTIEIAIEIG